MTVKELIKKLQALNRPDLDVEISFDYGHARTGVYSVVLYTGQSSVKDEDGSTIHLMRFDDDDINKVVILVGD